MPANRPMLAVQVPTHRPLDVADAGLNAVPHRRSVAWAAAASMAMVAALTACTSPAQNNRGAVVPQAVYQPAEASNPYTQTAWELARWTRVGGGLRPVPHAANGQQPLTLVFTQTDGQRRVSGRSGCNSYSADYTVANGLIMLTSAPFAGARNCASSDAAALERDYLTGLAHIATSGVDNYSNPQRLTMTFANGEIVDFARRLDPIAGQPGPAKLIYVNAQRAPCMGVAPMQCLQVRDTPSQPWQLHYGDIVGFDFQPGSIYRLRVIEAVDPNPPADAPSSRWVLDAVIERVVVGY